MKTRAGHIKMGMRLNAPRGQKVSYIRHDEEPWYGDDARTLLKPNGIYTVENTIVFRDHSYVCLAEYPDQEFNTALFEEVGDLLPAERSVEEIYKRSAIWD